MKKILIAMGQSLLSTLICLVLLEVVFRFVGAPGGSKFFESTVLREKLSRHKPKNEVRIFAFGESTMHGAHFGPTSNPARWLEAYLKDFLPDRKIRVVNFARIGFGTDFTYDTFRQSLFYKPDVAIFYLGHNDFLSGNRKDAVTKKKSKNSEKIRNLITRSYFISTVYRWVVAATLSRQGGDKSADTMEYDVIETPPRGFGQANQVPRGSAFYDENVEFFRFNMKRMHQLAKKHAVKALFMKPLSNLKDFSPFHSLHVKNLMPEELSRWEALYKEGVRQQEENNLMGAIKDFEAAAKIDETYAELRFRMGQIYFQKGELEKAREAFIASKDYDAIISRAPSGIVDFFDEFSSSEGALTFDTEKIFSPLLPGGIAGEPMVEDNVHFSIRGHQTLGRALADEIADREWIAPRTEWRFERERSYEDISKELGIDQKFIVSSYHKIINYFGSRFDNRIRCSLRALELDPGNAKSLRYLAWSQWLKGDKETAHETYQKLKDLHPQIYQEILSRHPEIEGH